MPLFKERGHPWYWNEAFLMEIFWRIKPKSKFDIWPQSIKKAMLDVRLIVSRKIRTCLFVSRVQFRGAWTEIFSYTTHLGDSDFRFLLFFKTVVFVESYIFLSKKGRPRLQNPNGKFLYCYTYQKRVEILSEGMNFQEPLSSLDFSPIFILS